MAVLIGYQTKFAAGLFIAFSMVDNIIFNAFWMHWGTYVFEIMKFDFFQQLSSIGGVMQLLIYGKYYGLARTSKNLQTQAAFDYIGKSS